MRVWAEVYIQASAASIRRRRRPDKSVVRRAPLDTGVAHAGARQTRRVRNAATGASLIDVLDGAIGAYMTELGRIAHQIDSEGRRDARHALAPLHPGEHGTGEIRLPQLGAFRGLEVTFRGEIAHPDGRTPGQVAPEG